MAKLTALFASVVELSLIHISGDIPVGVEAAVLIAVQDARVGHGGDGVVVPGVLRHVGEAVALAPVRVPALVGEHPEEDGGHLGPGDLPLGLHGLSGLVVGGLTCLIVHGIAHAVAAVSYTHLSSNEFSCPLLQRHSWKRMFV